jgi:hypothetical protein
MLQFPSLPVWERCCRDPFLTPLHSNSNADFWRSRNELTDELLVLRLLEGEQDALAVLFDRYHKLVFSVAARIVNDVGKPKK